MSWRTVRHPDELTLMDMMVTARHLMSDVCLTTNGAVYTVMFTSQGGQVLIDGDAYIDLRGKVLKADVDAKNVRISIFPEPPTDKLTVLIPLGRIVEASLREDLR